VRQKVGERKGKNEKVRDREKEKERDLADAKGEVEREHVSNA